MKFRVAWESLLTGHTGHGEYAYTMEEALAIQRNAELSHKAKGEITHWIEAEPEAAPVPAELQEPRQ